MRKLILPGIAVAIVLAAALLMRAPGATAAQTGLRPPTQKDVTVYLRGDASGVAFGDRVPTMTMLMHHSGKIEDYDDEWLKLASSDGKIYWFPRSTILSIVDNGK